MIIVWQSDVENKTGVSITGCTPRFAVSFAFKVGVKSRVLGGGARIHPSASDFACGFR